MLTSVILFRTALRSFRSAWLDGSLLRTFSLSRSRKSRRGFVRILSKFSEILPISPFYPRY